MVLTVNMDESRLRTQASSRAVVDDDDTEYLQRLVDFIVQNKNRLSSDLKSRLHDAFGKQPLQRTFPLRNREDALKRVRRVEREDITIPEYLRGAITTYEQRGDLFWAGESSISPEASSNNGTTYVTNNVLSDLYNANKKGTVANSVRRAFYCVALYRVIQRIMKLHGTKTLTKNIKSLCAGLILKCSDTTCPQKRDEVVKELTYDYGIGYVYDSYARKEGNGIIFYLFVVPTNVYEKYLNTSDDVDTVLDHYKSTGFQQKSSTISAAAKIMGVINDRFESQISLFEIGAIVPHRLIKPTPKRGRYVESPAEPSASKRLKTGQRTNLPRPRPVARFDGERNEAASRSNDTESGETYLQQAPFHPDGISPIVPERRNCVLGPSPSTDCLDETSSAQSAINGLEQNMVSRLLEPTAVVGPSVQRIADMNFRPQSPLPFGVDTPSDAARLMDQFQLESMIHDANASQLMQDFHLEEFNLADQLNAAQLMQQFDLYHGINNLQHT